MTYVVAALILVTLVVLVAAAHQRRVKTHSLGFIIAPGHMLAAGDRVSIDLGDGPKRYKVRSVDAQSIKVSPDRLPRPQA